MGALAVAAMSALAVAALGALAGAAMSALAVGRSVLGHPRDMLCPKFAVAGPFWANRRGRSP